MREPPPKPARKVRAKTELESVAPAGLGQRLEQVPAVGGGLHDVPVALESKNANPS